LSQHKLRKCPKSWESMQKFDNSLKSMIKCAMKCESLQKCTKSWESVAKDKWV
jgi:hypothetical protein